MGHLFGPVPSRRLGRSLGVDLIPPKTCPYDCLYCEVGRTTRKTLARREYDTEAIIQELKDYLARSGAAPDFITLAGSGEPTLNLGLGRIIKALKEMSDTPVAVLTNGALLYLPEVRQELARAEVVLPSLDAARQETFRLINRPLPDFSLEQLLAGLEAFRREFAGQLWLEIMLLKGLNDQETDLLALKQAIARIAPDKVQLNTAVRPVAAAQAKPLTAEEMSAVAAFLGEGVEVIAAFDRAPAKAAAVSDAAFLEALARRPMTAADLALALGLPLPLVQKRLHHLCESGRISYNFYQDQGFYRS
jgi:wyosine [tRNA(Phe)-imidazoG37] synthetase (radical SAM superfamily)